MEYIVLNNGVLMPILGFGTYGIHKVEVVKQAIMAGYRLIDTARMYNNEHIIGAAVMDCKVKRDELFITTKLCSSSNTYKQAKIDIDDSLNKLKLDYVDLLIIHEPYLQSFEMYDAIKEAFMAGKAKSIGVSNFNSKCYLEFVEKCDVIPAVNQLESNVYFTQFDLKNKIEEYGTKMQAWSPLANGINNIFSEKVLLTLAKKYNKSVAQIAIRYLIQNGVSVIPKTENINRMVENLDIFNFTISNDEMEEIKKLDKNKSTTNWYRSDWF